MKRIFRTRAKKFASFDSAFRLHVCWHTGYSGFIALLETSPGFESSYGSDINACYLFLIENFSSTFFVGVNQLVQFNLFWLQTLNLLIPKHSVMPG